MAAAPPTNARTISFRQLVIEADPTWTRDRRYHVEYRFSNGREFYGYTDLRGAYGENPIDGQWWFPDFAQSGHILTAGF